MVSSARSMRFELRDAGGFAFPNAMLGPILLVLPAAELAFDLHARTALQRKSEFSQLRPAMMRCHSVRDSQSLVSLFFQDVLVATDRMVKGMPLWVNFCSPSFPMKPINERRFFMWNLDLQA